MKYVLIGAWLVLVAIGPHKLNFPAQAQKAKSQAEQRPSPQPPIDANSTEKMTNEDQPTKMPPSDPWYRAYVIATIILVVVGSCGVYKAHQTLKAIEQQSKALVAQNRAWVILTEIETPHNMQKVKHGWIRFGFGFNWTIKNSGNSPAFITRVGARWHPVKSLNDLPLEPNIEIDGLVLPTAHYPYRLSIPPNGEIDRYTMAMPQDRQPATQEEYKEIREGESFWVAYGVIEYFTAFDSEKIRETRFCYTWMPSGEELFLRSDTPASYTRQT